VPQDQAGFSRDATASQSAENFAFNSQRLKARLIPEHAVCLKAYHDTNPEVFQGNR